MAKKLSSKAQKALALLDDAQRKLDRVHSLIEQYAAAKSGQDQWAGMISRAAADTGRIYMNAGLGVMADHANQIAMLAKRGGATQSKFRGLRELTGALRGEMERKRKAIADEDAAGGEPAG